MPGMLDPDAFDALTFDCYGTLIDWERGIVQALAPVLDAHGVRLGGDPLLEAFARHETALEAGPYRTYASVLGATLERIGAEHGFCPTEAEIAAFSVSVRDWPAFEDSGAALRSLAGRYRLAVLTNCDDELFAASARRLGVAFDEVVTAQQVGGYKPGTAGFEMLLRRLGLPRDRVLHVAQSLFHDHVPAKALGLATVWVDRRAGRAGTGATPPAHATPDLVVPDMASLTELLRRP